MGENGRYYHVTRGEWDGGPVQSAIERGIEVDWWPEYDGYMSSFDAEAVSLFSSLEDARRFLAEYLGGDGEILEIALDQKPVPNSEDFPSVPRVHLHEIVGRI